METLVIYKARIRDPQDVAYDELLPAPPPTEGVKFVIFRNDITESQVINGWTAHPIKVPEDLTNVRAARHLKIMSHELFPDADYTLWLDGVFSMGPSFKPWNLVKLYMAKGVDLVCHKHPRRVCAYTEAEYVRHKDPGAPIDAQVARMKRAGFPRAWGLSETGAMLRRNTPRIKKFNELWLSELEKGSFRDQISFDYCLWKTGTKRKFFAGITKRSPHFAWRPHHPKKRKTETSCIVTRPSVLSMIAQP